MSIQKYLHKGGSTRLRDSTLITACFTSPVLARVRLYTRAFTMVWTLRTRCSRATNTLVHALRMRWYSFMSYAGQRQSNASRKSG